MNKAILVLEENSVIHGLVASALDVEGVTLHHEFNPTKYVERANNLRPDLILVSNADQFNNYSICRQLKTGAASGAPLVLLANSKDRLDNSRLGELRVAGVVRKPFEASDLQQQVSKHLNLPDLIGAAYEYRQSQSAREDVYNPLAQMEVLDDETLALMKEAGQGQAAAVLVPEVDFSAELSEEPAAEAAPRPSATLAETTVQTMLRSQSVFTGAVREAEITAETMAEAPPEAMSGDFDDSDLAPFPITEGEQLLEAGLAEDEGVPADMAVQDVLDEEHLEELGVEDLLEDEMDLDSGAMPEPEETADMEPMQPSTLDQIDVELSASDLSLSTIAAAKEARPDDMTLFEQEFDTSAAPPRPVDETIPLALRRMMELRPVFTAPEVPAETAAAARVTQVSMETFATAVAPMPEPEEALPALGGDETLDDLTDIDLGDEGLDEEQILSAMESEPMAEVDAVEGLDEDDLASLQLDEDVLLSDLPEIPAMDEEMAAPDDDDEEITIDEDEEELILSSLDQEEEMDGRALRAAPVRALDLTSTEREGLDQILAAQEPVTGEVATLTEQDEAEIAQIDDSLAMIEEEVTKSSAALEPLPPPESELADFSPEEQLEVPDTHQGELISETPELETLTAIGTAAGTAVMQETSDELEWKQTDLAIDFGSDDLQADLFSSTDLAAAGDELEPAEAEPAEAEPEEELEPAEAGHKGGDSDSDFAAAFAELQAEIETNPEGERLDDVLRMEGIQDRVTRLEFTIPQHETPFARGIGIYAMPGQPEAVSPHAGGNGAAMGQTVRTQATGTVVTTTTTTMTDIHLAEAARGAGLLGGAASGSLLDEATKARLSEVLDEIISISVRKAVREEMPRLMQRLVKEPPRA